MLKKFSDFNVEEYKLNHILESLDNEVTSDGIDASFLDTPISDDEYLLKASRVIMRALKKGGVNNFAVCGTVVYVNGKPGVWFFETDNEAGKSFVFCKDSYTKVIAVFNHFELDGKNTAEITYSSEKLGLKDMIEQVVEDMKSVNVNESVLNEAFKAKAGYGPKHIAIVERWSPTMKDFVVKLLESLSPAKAAGEILKNVGSNPICKDIYDSIDGKDSVMKYVTYIISDALNGLYEEVRGVLDPSLVGSGSALRVSVDDAYDVESYEAERAEERKKWLEKETQDFEESTQMIKDIVDTFCHYVKQNGQLNDDDKSVFTTKGLYITGRAGAGKSYALEQTLKKNGMVEKKDYVDVGNGATDVDALYRMMYKFNGKLILLDDAANVVSGTKRVAFWKRLLQTRPQPIKMPREVRDSSTECYEVGKKTRQERYFAEIGQKSNEEKNEFFKKKRREYGGSGKKGEEMAGADMDNLIAAEWDELKKNTKPLIPDEFVFNGCVVVIGNMSLDELETEVVKTGGKGDWEAIRQRFQPVRINPPYEVMWNVIQKQLREQQSMTEEELPSEQCIIPRKDIEDFINEVNYLLEGNEGSNYTGVSWRMTTQMGIAFRGEKGRRMWKRRLREILRTSEA